LILHDLSIGEPGRGDRRRHRLSRRRLHAVTNHLVDDTVLADRLAEFCNTVQAKAA